MTNALPAASENTTRTMVLADFAASLNVAKIPPEVRHRAKRALVDWLAAALAGSADRSSVKLRAVVSSVSHEQVATVVGSGRMSSAPFAALANGYATHAVDFDDVYNPPETTIHLGSCVWPTVLALAEMRGLTGVQVLSAYLAGFEVGARVGRAAGLTHFESSWQVTGTAGHVAAAAAASRAVGLSGPQTAHALGMAAAAASGIREVYGSDAKALQPGRAAMNGVLAALMAENGMTARDTAIEGQRGLLSVISRDPRPDLLTEALGDEWAVLSNGHKLYPNASLLHPAIDAAVALSNEPGFSARSTTAVEVRMLPFATSVTAVRHPAPGADARFSAAHCVAFALAHGHLGLESFGATAIADVDVTRLRELVTVVADDTVGKRGACVVVALADGKSLIRSVRANRGTPDNPMSDAELDAKLRSVGVPMMGIHAVNELLGNCWDLDTLPRASAIMRPMRHPD